MRLLSAILCCLTAALVSAKTKSAPATVAPGQLIPRVGCAGVPGQAYALYVPSNYTAERAWPVLYCFDPRADARRAIERFIPAAEALGYVVAASWNSRNSDPEGAGVAAEAMLQDSHRILRLDARRRYAAGFSGGAVVAVAVAAATDAKGVIAVGAPLSPERVLDQGTFALFGAAGMEDFNYQRVREVDEALREHSRRQRFVSFPGQHEWCPAAVATQALEWFDLLARLESADAAEGNRVEDRFQVRMQRAAAEPDPVRRHTAYQTIIDDFEGWCDVGEARSQVERIAAGDAYRSHLRAEKRSRQEEEHWNERLQRAANAVRLDLPQEEPVLQAPRIPRFGAEAAGEIPGSGRDGAFGFARPTPSLASVTPTQGWWTFAALAERARRAAEDEVGVRRALNNVFVGHLEAAQQDMAVEDFQEAIGFLRVATLLYPTSSDAQFGLARAYAMLGRVREGREALEAALEHGSPEPELVAAIEYALAHPEQAVVALQPFVVRESSMLTTSFGLALTVLAEPGTGRIRQVIVKDVAETSDAAAQGIRAGDVILEADGVALETVRARFDRGSRFYRFFMKRDAGDTIALRVASGDTGAVRSVHLVQRGMPRLTIPYAKELR